jgi:DNA-binding NtrC family response regulator
LNDNNINVIILDIKLPTPDVIETMNMLKNKFPNKEIVLTCYRPEKKFLNNIKSDRFLFLEKPTHTVTLVNYIERAFKKQTREIKEKMEGKRIS